MTSCTTVSKLIKHDLFLLTYADIFLRVGRISTTENITQRFELVNENDKRSMLLDLLTSIQVFSYGLVSLNTYDYCRV